MDNIDGQAVSIVVYVNNFNNAQNVFDNYMQQNSVKKEMILIHNNPFDDFEQWIYFSRLYPLVRVYQANNDTFRGECLNYCIERAIFEYIAIFGDADKYEPGYLASSIAEISHKQAFLTGKSSYFTSSDNINKTLFNPGNEKRFTDFVILPTFVFERSSFKILQFQNANEDLDVKFCEDCRNRSLTIYASGFDNFIKHI